jgi:hypothetical protein
MNIAEEKISLVFQHGTQMCSHVNYWGMHPVARVSIKYQNTSICDKY